MSRFVPRGVTVAGLGRRFLAFLLDYLPVLVLAGAVAAIFWLNDVTAVRLVTGITAGVLFGAYGIVQWWAYGTRGAGLGARAAGVRLVGIDDGEPIGWWRYFLRQLVFTGLWLTVVGGIAMVVFLIIQERRQGWHDMAARAIIVEPPPQETRAPAPPSRSTVSTVGLPPHLASGFAPQAGTTTEVAPPQSWQSYAPPVEPDRPAWLPQIEAEPVGPAPVRPMPRSDGGNPQPLGAAQQATGFNSPAGTMPSADPVPASPAARRASQDDDSTSTRLSAIPAPSSVVQPRLRERPPAQDDHESTHISFPTHDNPRRSDQGWYIRLDDGREVDLGVAVLLGRNPQKTQGDPDVQLVPAGGDGRMISRTHVLVDTDPNGVYIVDRGSTNGTAVVSPDGGMEPCPVGAQVRVKDRQQVSYGDRWFTVLRR